ncbi:class I SAM-dependent methyltransferase [Chitinophaga filiformis]|uniref:class I SAM-dependent methyltransferase n=1 Tax=Chitinophaga filiformis TaxID=104663 RepID=UPI001F3160E3|nr:class I SAM-dependent methyltransferase [Chitinophaga filiformis]MCF6406768.1 class I SAM-dependent methyltransferase [Chitinophaga filiformis]
MRPTWFMADASFDWLYPERIQQMSRRHWTPMRIAKKAAGFLAEEGKKVLDIGSGVGKFTLIGAHYYPRSFFYGVEQRSELHHYALAAQEYTKTENAAFINLNFTQVNLAAYDHFYFYNAFFENLATRDTIDHHIEYSDSLYQYYSRYLYRELDRKPAGTRLVTYHSLHDEIPPAYRLVETSADFFLKMWVKR